MKTATLRGGQVIVNNKHNEELIVDDDILVLLASGETKIMTITGIVDAKNSIVKAKNKQAKSNTTCSCGLEMPLVKTSTFKKKTVKKYACTCGNWATKCGSKWHFGSIN